MKLSVQEFNHSSGFIGNFIDVGRPCQIFIDYNSWDTLSIVCSCSLRGRNGTDLLLSLEITMHLHLELSDFCPPTWQVCLYHSEAAHSYPSGELITLSKSKSSACIVTEQLSIPGDCS